MLQDAAILIESDMRRAMLGNDPVMQAQAQALALGLSFLRRADQLGIKTITGLDGMRKRFRLEVLQTKGEDEMVTAGKPG